MSQNHRARGRSQRQLRVGEVIRHSLSAIIEREEFRDPVLSDASVTVTEVRVSPDLRNATAFIVPLGGEGTDEIIGALRHAAPFLRRKLGERVDLKRLPALSFEADSSFDYADRISDLLRDVRSRPDGDGDGA